MEKTRIDKTQDLFDWLDKNAKVVAEPADMATGSGKETIYACPVSKEDEFNKVFYKAFCDREDLSEFGTPHENEVWEVVTGGYETVTGPYQWRKRGYDFDGFYEPGSSGKVDCARYRTFREATIYHYTDWRTKQSRVNVDIKSYADGTPVRLFVVCFQEENNEISR